MRKASPHISDWVSLGTALHRRPSAGWLLRPAKVEHRVWRREAQNTKKWSDAGVVRSMLDDTPLMIVR